jgi:spermidine/putrescine transport system substrate-binding protein
MTHRRLAACLVLAAAILAPGLARAQTKELFLFNWSNYTPPEMLKRFEAETGIAVHLDVYGSNDALLAKLQAGGSGYDVIVPTGSTLRRLIDAGKVQKFEASSLPNFKNIRPPFDKPSFDPTRSYSVPYMWGTTGFAYDTDKAGKLDDSWKALFEPSAAFVGGIGMLDETASVWNAAAYYLAIDPCTTSGEDAQKILDLLQKQKPDVKLYAGGGSIDRLVSGETPMHMTYNGAAHRAHMKKPSIVYVYPREGLAVWGDNFAIPVGAPHVENAKIFLNWMMDPKNAAEASNFTGYNNTIAGSDQYLSPALRDDPAVNMPADYAARLREDRVCPQASIDLRERVWTRLMR